jgi:hypothetical protein
LSCSSHSCSSVTPTSAALGGLFAVGDGGGDNAVTLLAGDGGDSAVTLLAFCVLLALLAFCAQTPRTASARHSTSCARRAVICALCACARQEGG